MDIELIARVASTLPEDDEHPYRTGPWRPQHNEMNVDRMEVTGEIPADLNGVYLRNTENPIHPAIQRYHPFDGDGMVHLVGFRDGQAFYRNRFVRTAGMAMEGDAGRSLWAGIAEDPRLSEPDVGWGAREAMKDASSTDVVVHAGAAVTSFYQCGDLYRLDPLSLDTIGTTSWDGAFPEAGVSAHPKVDEHTGELLFFNYSKHAPYFHYGVADADNRLVHYTPVELPGPRLPHDMAYTERYAIFNDLPLFWDETLLAKGVHAARLHDLPTRLGVLPRRADGGEVTWFEFDPTYVLHWTNAWEEGDEVVVEGFFQDNPVPDPPKDDAMRMFRYLALDQMGTRLHRWRMNMVTGAVSEERLRDDVTEFGVVDQQRWGHKTRYVYACTGVEGWFLLNGLVKHDTLTGTDQRYRFAEGVYCSEPVFVARDGAAAEDDGYVMTITIDMNNDMSECLIFNATDLAEGPVARVRLPERVSSGTHATWADASVLPNWDTAAQPLGI